MRLLTRDLTLGQPRSRVFEFFADAANLGKITPPELQFQILTPLPLEMRVGARIEYTIRLWGVPMLWKTVIEEWNPPISFIDRQEEGPYDVWIHRHSFEDGGGETRMRDEVRYALPGRRFGDLAHPLIRRQLDRIFDFREEAVRGYFGENATTSGNSAPPGVASP